MSLTHLLNSRSMITSIIAVLALIGVALLIARAQSSFADPVKAQQLVKEGALLVDVRSPQEFASGHIKGAKNIPVSEVATRLKEFGDTQKPIVVYCRSGARSARAQSTLKGAGFTQVYNLGGMNRWPTTP